MTPRTSLHTVPLSSILVVSGLIAGLFWTSRVNYLLFHSLVEIFSITVAGSLFMIAWNSRGYIKNQYILFVGLAYLFIGLLDLLHTLSYKGMSIFTDYDYYANQVWIATRFLESLSLLGGLLFLTGKRTISPPRVLFFYSVVTGLITASIYLWKVFPICFVDGVGLTPFKKISEYIICLILFLVIFLLYRNRMLFDEKVYRYMVISVLFTVIAELAFTFYVSNYGFSNLVGHFFKMFSYLYIYRSIVRTGIRQPYKIIFHELDTANQALSREIDVREKTEREKEALIRDLTRALDEIRTLEGIIPICMHCKNIRDDKGYWNRIEKYIQDHSEAEFSHSICPSCMKKHYAHLITEEGPNDEPEA